MQTGDLIFYKQKNYMNPFADSPLVHVGFILENPEFLGLKGTYIWKNDSYIYPFKPSQKFWVRKFRGEIGNETLKMVHGRVQHFKSEIVPDEFSGFLLKQFGLMDPKEKDCSSEHLANFFSKYYCPM